MRTSTLVGIAFLIALAYLLFAKGSAAKTLSYAQKNLDSSGNPLPMPFSAEGDFGSNIQFTKFPLGTFDLSGVAFSPSDFGGGS